MIKKILGICLAMSCYLLPLMVLAQSNEMNNIAVNTATKSSANALVNKTAVEAVVSYEESAAKDADKVAVDERLTAQLLIHKAAIEKTPVEQAPLEPLPTESNAANSKPQVGKHVMANMNAGSMILSLLMVLGLIIVCGFVLKRFNLTSQSVNQLKLVTSLRLGTKERVIVVQVGEQQLLLGVTSQQVTLLETLAEPLPLQSIKTADLSKNILSFLSAKKK